MCCRRLITEPMGSATKLTPMRPKIFSAAFIHYSFDKTAVKQKKGIFTAGQVHGPVLQRPIRTVRM